MVLPKPYHGGDGLQPQSRTKRGVTYTRPALEHPCSAQSHGRVKNASQAGQRGFEGLLSIQRGKQGNSILYF